MQKKYIIINDQKFVDAKRYKKINEDTFWHYKVHTVKWTRYCQYWLDL
jgi:hypothetical protein